jgi:hypothetical protein
MENTNDQLVTPKVFELAKEKGYVHSKLSLYIMPSQSYLQRWLREAKNIDVQITSYRKHGNKVYSQEVYYGEFINISNGFVRKTVRENTVYITFKKYEQALEEGLEQGLTVCPNCL